MGRSALEQLHEQTDEAGEGWLMLLWCVAVVLFLLFLAANLVCCKEYLDRVSRPGGQGRKRRVYY
jgi:hypothetical protein